MEKIDDDHDVFVVHPYPALILSSYDRALEVIAKAFTFVSLNRSTNGDEFPAFFTIVIQERHACRFVHVGSELQLSKMIRYSYRLGSCSSGFIEERL